MKIAMWSGPRNLSTAMMYSFGNRPDCAVVDEPFYAAFLDKTGIDHPMREAVLASQSCDPRKVVAELTGENPKGRPVFYQKHMTHHMVDGIPRDWFDQVHHAFLIRHPARVIASYVAKRENPTLDDIGFAQQTEIFEEMRALGVDPVVVDSFDVRRDPRGTLTKLCGALGIGFDPAMLHWPKGGHASDGVWAAHWYPAVHGSSGFAGEEGDLPDVPESLREIYKAALPHYKAMKAVAL